MMNVWQFLLYLFLYQNKSASHLCLGIPKNAHTRNQKRGKSRKKGGGQNKYRGGTSDATTPSSVKTMSEDSPLIVSLNRHLMTFYPQKRPYSSFEYNTGPTDGHDLL